MSEFPEFRFQGFLLRPAIDDDLLLAAEWTCADPDHMGKVQPDFWIKNSTSINSFVLEDSIGAIFFFRIDQQRELKYPATGLPRGAEAPGDDIMSRSSIPDTVMVCEVHIQFPPHDQRGMRLRTMQGMAIGFDWLKNILGQNGYEAVYFTSKNQRLIDFATQRLGFFTESVTAGETRLKAYLERGYDTESV